MQLARVPRRVGHDGVHLRRGQDPGHLWPISAFVTLGFEHSIANMFLIPHGMLNGAQVTVGEMMMNNIIPVTLGNMFAAAVFVAGIHYYAYGRK